MRPPCRFEAIGNVIFDVAHNPDGFSRLLEAFKFHFPGRRFRLLIGMSQDKDIRQCLRLMCAQARHIYLVKAPTKARRFPPRDGNTITRGRVPSIFLAGKPL